MTDYAEALRLIRKHMQPGDTLGQMFMRVARELETLESVGDKRRPGSVDSAPLAQSIEPPLCPDCPARCANGGCSDCPHG